jgi:hypothetical protein
MKMATGPQMLQRIQQNIKALPFNDPYWIGIPEKLDLCKLTVADLIAADFSELEAARVFKALNRQDVAVLGDALGVSLRIKFKVWAKRDDRDTFLCTIKAEGKENAEWLRSLLRSKVPGTDVSELCTGQNERTYDFSLRCNNAAPVWKIQRALIDCPAIHLRENLPVGVSERPHYQIQASDLALWIESQGEDSWWIVDGDPLLTSRVSFPCPPDELSAELRRINRPLLVSDPNDSASGEEIRAEEGARMVDMDELGKRRLYLSWKDGPSDWLLVEDEALVGAED